MSKDDEYAWNAKSGCNKYYFQQVFTLTIIPYYDPSSEITCPQTELDGVRDAKLSLRIKQLFAKVKNWFFLLTR